LVAGLAVGVMALILIGLGTWQLQRLQWKLGLIERAHDRAHAAPMNLANVISTFARDPDVEYTHVRAEGRLRNDLERYLYATGPDDWGWDVFTPLELGDGAVIMINRGFLPRNLRVPVARASGEPAESVTLTGLVRLYPGSKPWYIPDARPEKAEWNWPDVVGMARSAYGDSQRVAPFYIDEDPKQAAAPPTGGATNLNLPNRHLEYALTWFGLAASLLVVFGIHLYRGPGP
jgi:surfeit locus 1 family protein